MSDGIGEKIKYFRIKHNLTQEELAKGIVSVSYLSKIERNAADPNPEAVKKLCERLGISPEKVLDKDIVNDVMRWMESLLKRDLVLAHDLYQGIQTNIEKVIDADLFCLVKLHTLYYFVLTKQTDKAKRKLKLLKQDQKHFSKKETYYWLKFKAHFEYAESSYEKAFLHFQEAERLYSDVFKGDSEEYYDLIYHVAKTATVLHYSYHASVYAERALIYYRDHYRLERAAKCHILKGVNYKRIREMDEALKQFELAEALGKRLSSDTILFRVYEAIGELFYDLKMSTQAIRYYSKAYELVKHQFSVQELIAILGHVKTYIQCDKQEFAKDWLEKADTLLKTEKNMPLRYVYQVKVLRFVLYGFTTQFEKLLVKEVIPYFKSRKLNIAYAAYVRLLGDYYYNNRKYKLAAEYYAEAHQAMVDIQHTDNK